MDHPLHTWPILSIHGPLSLYTHGPSNLYIDRPLDSGIYIYIHGRHSLFRKPLLNSRTSHSVSGPSICGYPVHTEFPRCTCTIISIHGPSSPFMKHPLWTKTVISRQRSSSEHMDHSLYTLTIFSAHGWSSVYWDNTLYAGISFSIHVSSSLHWNLLLISIP